MMHETRVYRTDSEEEQWEDESDEEGLLGKRKASPSPEPEKKKVCLHPST